MDTTTLLIIVIVIYSLAAAAGTAADAGTKITGVFRNTVLRRCVKHQPREIGGRSRFLSAGFCVASNNPMFDRRTFSGLLAILFAWPWIDYIPSAWFPLAIILNAIIIFGLFSVLSLVPALFRRPRI